MQNKSTIKSRIQSEAARLGFFHVGVSPVDTTPHFDFFMRWLADGRNGDMTYLVRQALKRRNPRLVFPEAASLMVLGMNYFSVGGQKDSPLKGKISRYAWGEDYHDVVGGRLEALLSFIRREDPSADGICYVDTGPLMEKAWGARTTVGWMGKHTNLISKKLGSWFFIGVILLNVPLEPDPPLKNHCGTCRRCLEVCPTGAIVAPYVVDARLCISYLTIENRGPIPRRLRPLLGNRIFGCDDCQEVCPWNRFCSETCEKSFYPGVELAMPDLLSLAAITNQEFKRRFRKSPIYRATRDGLVRNAVTALGNSGRDEALPVLERALQDSSALVRGSAVWALGRILPKAARDILLKEQREESDLLVLEEIKVVLAQN